MTTSPIATNSPGVQAYVDRGAELAAAEARRRAIMRQKRFEHHRRSRSVRHAGRPRQPGQHHQARCSSHRPHFENSDQMETALAYLMPGWISSARCVPHSAA